jgi:hypothetical protein
MEISVHSHCTHTSQMMETTHMSFQGMYTQLLSRKGDEVMIYSVHEPLKSSCDVEGVRHKVLPLCCVISWM